MRNDGLSKNPNNVGGVSSQSYLASTSLYKPNVWWPAGKFKAVLMDVLPVFGIFINKTFILLSIFFPYKIQSLATSIWNRAGNMEIIISMLTKKWVYQDNG